MKLPALVLSYFLVLTVHGQVTFIVNDLPDNHDGSSIFIAGGFNNWTPDSVAYQLKQTGDTYAITIQSDKKDIDFKFTRGNWNAVETDEWGKDIANRWHHFSAGHDTVFVKIATWKDLEHAELTSKSANVITIEDFYIPQLDRSRRVWIYLPPDYNFTNTHYPVIYMHDGQNLFDDATAFAGEWEVDESLDEIFEQSAKGFIVVGVDNGGEKRIAEYSPWSNNQYGGGEGDAYSQFLVEVLKPYVDENYRTLTDRSNTSLVGSSLGGLISIYAGLNYSEVFGKIGALSPAFWFNPEIYTFIDTVQTTATVKVYMSAGGDEPKSVETNMNTVYDILESKGFDELKQEVHPGREHNEAYWRSIFSEVMSWLEDLPEVLNIQKNELKCFIIDGKFGIRSPFNDEYQATFYDLSGRLLLQDTVSNMKSVSLDQIEQGILVVNLSNSNYKQTMKLRVR